MFYADDTNKLSKKHKRADSIYPNHRLIYKVK